MGKLLDFNQRSLEYHYEKEKKEYEYFKEIKIGLNDSMDEIHNTLYYVDDWEELLNLNTESLKEKFDNLRSKTLKIEYKDRQCCFIFLGVIFCLIHLIGIHEGIIMLKALFKEIKDSIALKVAGTPREFSFYEFLEIASYKDIPEIDVAMTTSTIGIIFLKKFEFYCSNVTFQLASAFGFVILFLIFDFHKDERLSEDYSVAEIVVLLISYVLLSITVGFSSTLALKEYWDLILFIKNMILMKVDAIK